MYTEFCVCRNCIETIKVSIHSKEEISALLAMIKGCYQSSATMRIDSTLHELEKVKLIILIEAL